MHRPNCYILSVPSYAPFGMLLLGRSWEAGSGYRYGFNAQEQDDEVYGNGNLNTAEFWGYDTRLGRRWNLDPIVKFHISSYAVFENCPLYITDPAGNDTLLYSKNSGMKIATKENSYDKKSPIWIVDDNAKGFDPNNPWATATALEYHIGKNKSYKNYYGTKLRHNHPLKNIGWTNDGQVYFEDLLDMTSEFESDVTDAMYLFGTTGKSYRRQINNKFTGAKSRAKLTAAMNVAFAGLVAPNRPYDLKSETRAGLDRDACYGSEYIGEWSIYDGTLMHFDDYGNYAFGVWGRTFGLSLNRITSAANIAQQIDKGKSDPARDQYMINQGFQNMLYFRDLWLMENIGSIGSENQ